MSQSLAWPTKFHGSPKLHQPPKALSLLLQFSQLPSASSRLPSAPLPGPCKLSWFPGPPEVPQSHFWVPEIPLGSLSLALGLPRSFGPQNWPETPILLSTSPNPPLRPQRTAGGRGLNRHPLRGPRPPCGSRVAVARPTCASSWFSCCMSPPTASGTGSCVQCRRPMASARRRRPPAPAPPRTSSFAPPASPRFRSRTFATGRRRRRRAPLGPVPGAPSTSR